MVTVTRNTRMAPVVEPLKIETHIELPTPINLGQVLTVACGQPSWMSAFTRNHRDGFSP